MLDKSAHSNHYHDEPGQSFIDTLVSLKALSVADASQNSITLATVIDRLDERAFGLLILLFAIPCLVPGLPGAQLIAIPIFLMGAQLALGQSELWLPKRALATQIKPSWIETIATFVDKRLRWTERVSKPRLLLFTTGLSERVLGGVIALAAITIMLPSTNTVPSSAIALMSIGLLQRDGLFTLAGMSIALAWISVLTVMIWGLFAGAGFAVTFVGEHFPWLLQMLGH
jgi:hypothetical protein